MVVSGLSSGGVLAAWLSAYAAPGQIRAAVYEDPPLFASETTPAIGPSIRQGPVGHIFRLRHRWLGPQWSIGDEAGLQAAMAREVPEWLPAAVQSVPGGLPPAGPRQNLREYDPEWGDAFVSGRVALTCDHEAMLRQVKVPVLFTHHFHHVDPDTGNLIGASSDEQVRHVRGSSRAPATRSPTASSRTCRTRCTATTRPPSSPPSSSGSRPLTSG
ncbi:hypothetical protein ACFQX6_08530 [Streptosporangium lutulentum]